MRHLESLDHADEIIDLFIHKKSASIETMQLAIDETSRDLVHERTKHIFSALEFSEQVDKADETGVDFLDLAWVAPKIVAICTEILSEVYQKDRSREHLRRYYITHFKSDIGI